MAQQAHAAVLVEPKRFEFRDFALPQIGADKINYSAGYGPTGASIPPGSPWWMRKPRP